MGKKGSGKERGGEWGGGVSWMVRERESGDIVNGRESRKVKEKESGKAKERSGEEGV